MELGDRIMDNSLPKNPPDPEPDSFKQMKIVLDTVKQLTELTSEEKSILEQMIQKADPRLLVVVNKSTSSHELTSNLIELVRSCKSPSAMDTSQDASPSISSQINSQLQSEIDAAMKKLSFQKPLTIKTSLSNVQKALQTFQKHPEESKNRKLRMDNVGIKKNIIDIPGSLQLMEIAGFKQVTEKDKSGKELHYIEIDKGAVKNEALTVVIDAVTHKLSGSLEEFKVPATPGKRVICLGGCGFWGDENTESLCSQCHKKKYFGVKEQPAKKEPQLCIKECGFFGMDQFKGMCSKCFQKSGEKAVVPPKDKKQIRKAKWKAAKLKLRAVRMFQMVVKRPEQKNKNRCYSCDKRIGTTEIPGIECRCGYTFCPSHRLPHDHDCPYNFKERQKQKLARENNKVNHKKFDTIEES